jgi:two-component system sensor histidine kinase RpfC
MLSHFLVTFRQKVRKVRGAIRSENRDQDLEQSSLRVTVSSIAVVYVWGLILTGGGFSNGLVMGLIAGSSNALIGAWMIWALRGRKFGVVPLRYLGAIADNVALAIGMAGAGEGGVAVIGVYLWVTIGNGFRFGPRYLLVSYWLSLLSFGVQLIFVPFWQAHRAVGIGLELALAIVPLYVLVLLIRLTAQKEAAEQLSNAKSRFVANVSHELRTPLTGIYAVYDLLRGRKMTPDDRELVGMLGSAVKTLKTSVDAVLQMSKLEAGAETSKKTIFNLWFLLHQLSAHIRPQSAAKHIGWHLEIDPSVPSVITGDPDHLAHILGNLLSNAFKFTSAGSVTLRVVLTGGDHIRFEVMDTGIGIPLDQQEHLFERFVQVDSSATRRYGGTGLGTSIARDLTELLGGKIGLNSAPGKGSTFWVDLPLLDTPLVRDPPDWSGWTRVLVVGPAGADRDQIASVVRAVGLEAVIADAALEEAPDFSSERYVASFLVMSAAEAANYSEAVLPDRAGTTCPWLVKSPNYSAVERATLARSGAAGLLPSIVTVDALRTQLAALLPRFESPSSLDGPSLDSSVVLRPLTILLADDNVSNQMLLSRILRDVGHTIQTAYRGDDAFEQMAAGGVDLAILDLNMPDMTGPAVIKLFRASSIGDKKLPIIILSADATPAARQESLEAGADEFLTKPVSAAMLLNTIERVIAGSVARVESLPKAEVSRTEFASDATPLLVDQDRIQDLRRIARGDQKFLDRYIFAAFEDIENAVTALGASMTSGKISAMRDALHIIEGTGASIGAIALVTSCHSMRRFIAAPRSNEIADTLAELSTTYALTKSTILAGLHGHYSLTSSGAPRR